MNKPVHTIWWICAVLLYAVSVTLSAQRIYILHDYPVYITEEEIPDVLYDVTHFFSSK